jgi:hypothetical protein
MRILVRVDFGTKVEKIRAAWGHRESFWTTYNSLSFDGSQETTEDEIRAREERIRTEFPWILRRKLLAALAGESEVVFSKKIKLPSLRKSLQLIVSKIEYNSLDIILDVVGIDHKGMYEIAFSLIEMYAPASLNEAIGNTRVNLTYDFVRLDIVQEDLDDEPTFKYSKSWRIVNSALLLLIGLAVAVLCLTFVAATEYLADLRTEKRAYAERAIKENDTIYRLLLDTIKSSREHEEALMKIISDSLAATPEKSRRRKKGR